MKLVFIHGSGMSGLVWQYQLKHFQNAQAPDLPGHPKGQLPQSMDNYASFMKSYLEDLSEDVVVVGHSLGGAVALMLAKMKIANLKGIILIGSGARLRVMPMILDALSKSALNNNEIPSFMFSMNQLIKEPLRSQIVSMMQENGASVMLNDLSICDRFDMMDELEDVTLPTLVLVGDKDQMTPPKYAEFMVKAMPNARVDVIESGTHMVFAEQAEKVNQLIGDFCSELN